MRDISHPELDTVPVTGVLNALSDPIRLRIVKALVEHGGEMSCGDFNLPIAKATASHHFKVLREAGIIVCVAKGTMRMTSLNREELDRRFPTLLDTVLNAVGPV